MKPNDSRETPPELFSALDAEFHFTLDVCASVENAKCTRFYTELDNGLVQYWGEERVFCNPPYSDIRPWVEKAWNSRAKSIVMLVPANRTEQPWWQQWVEPYRDGREPGCDFRVQFLAGRTRFVKDGVRMGSPKFGCCLLVWT